MRIRIVCAVLAGAVLSGCNGWPAAPELAEVENMPEKYPTYLAMPAEQAEAVRADPYRWLRGARTLDGKWHTALPTN